MIRSACGLTQTVAATGQSRFVYVTIGSRSESGSRMEEKSVGLPGTVAWERQSVSYCQLTVDVVTVIIRP